MSKRDEYVAQMKQQLDELNTRIDELDAKIQNAKGESLEAYETQMAKLREHSQAAQAKIKEVKEAGEDSWEKLVGETKKVLDAAVHSFNYFKSQL